MTVMNPLRRVILLLGLLLLLALGVARAATPAVDPAVVMITPAQVRACLEDYLLGKKAFLPQARIGFRSLELPGPFQVPAGTLSCEVHPSDPKILGSRRFTLIFRVDGQVVKNTALRGELEAIAPVVIAAGELRRGMILAQSDLNLAEMDLAGLRNPCADPAELIGKKLKRSVRLGDPIDRQAVEFPAAINRGDLVTLTARKGALVLSATGVAREDGNAGETIVVRNNASQKDIRARVAGPGAVEVEF